LVHVVKEKQKIISNFLRGAILFSCATAQNSWDIAEKIKISSLFSPPLRVELPFACKGGGVGGGVVKQKFPQKYFDGKK